MAREEKEKKPAVNISGELDGNRLHIWIDMEEEHGLSTTGKSVIIADSGKFPALGELPIAGLENTPFAEYFINLYLGRKKKDGE